MSAPSTAAPVTTANGGVEAKAGRALALVAALPGSSVPSRPPAAEPADVSKAYKAALGTAHLLTAGELCERLGVDPRQGLGFGEAAARVEKYGQNSAGSAEAVLAGTEAWASQRHLQAVTVLRGGQAISVTPNTLVVGDVVYLEEAEHVPADLRILTSETVVAPQVRRRVEGTCIYAFTRTRGHNIGDKKSGDEQMPGIGCR